MALNPVIKDLSGNGYDAICHNFSWSQMSGIGGYSENFKLWKRNADYLNPEHMSAIEETDCHFSLVDIHPVPTDYYPGFFSYENYIAQSEQSPIGYANFPGMSFRITGMPDPILDGFFIRIYAQLQGYKQGWRQDIYSDGIYSIPKGILTRPSTDSDKNLYYGFSIFNRTNETIQGPIQIEQLPYYPNAIISDGVDDYADVEINNALSASRGYTVIAKRKYTDEMINGTRYGSLITDNKTRFVSGVFSLEAMSPSVDYKYFAVSSFGSQIQTFERNQLLKDDIVYLKSNYYEGNLIQKGELTAGTDLLTLFRNVNVMSDHSGKYILYSLAVFDRDLTTYEIELAKALYL